MTERLRNYPSYNFRYRIGAAALLAGLVLGASACADSTDDCEQSFPISQSAVTLGSQLSTPDGQVDISFTSRYGEVDQVFLEQGSLSREFQKSDLSAESLEFALVTTAIEVDISDEVIAFSCRSIGKTEN
jgi:hypothetical protein